MSAASAGAPHVRAARNRSGRDGRAGDAGPGLERRDARLVVLVARRECVHGVTDRRAAAGRDVEVRAPTDARANRVPALAPAGGGDALGLAGPPGLGRLGRGGRRRGERGRALGTHPGEVVAGAGLRAAGTDGERDDRLHAHGRRDRRRLGGGSQARLREAHRAGREHGNERDEGGDDEGTGLGLHGDGPFRHGVPAPALSWVLGLGSPPPTHSFFTELVVGGGEGTGQLGIK